MTDGHATAERAPLTKSTGKEGAGHNVAWGDFRPFLAYTGRITPCAPHALTPIIGWTASTFEVALGLAPVLGILTRAAAAASAALLAAFAIGMTAGIGVKTAFDASVFSASAGAVLLACAPQYPLTFTKRPRHRST
jgi:uncharacterized membrane protein YphA (DoxX/SURF4 family)